MTPPHNMAERVADRFSAEHIAARELLLNSSIAAGRFPESRRAHYAALYDASPKEAQRVIASITPVASVGAGAVPAPLPRAAGQQPAYPEQTLTPAERSRIEHARAGLTAPTGGAIEVSSD